VLGNVCVGLETKSDQPGKWLIKWECAC